MRRLTEEEKRQRYEERKRKNLENYYKNRGKRIEQMKEYRSNPENREKMRLAMKEWHARNRDRHLAYLKAYYHLHREERLAAMKAWREEKLKTDPGFRDRERARSRETARRMRSDPVKRKRMLDAGWLKYNTDPEYRRYVLFKDKENRRVRYAELSSDPEWMERHREHKRRSRARKKQRLLESKQRLFGDTPCDTTSLTA